MSHTPSQPQLSTDEKADKRLNKRLKDMPIAIVGMASIFANSRYLNKFWDLICDKIDAITDVPESHWSIDDYYDADKSKADKSYCKRGGFMPEVDFNPMEFGLPPNILELTDSSQLLSLVVAKEVLQDANLPDDYDRDRIGITLGIGGGQKLSHSLNARLQYPVLKKVFKSSGLSDEDSELLIKKFQDQYVHWEENSFPGSLGNVIAGRIANRFDLGGMNCVVDAACAGSLAAMRMALTELTEGRSDMMITGGVCTDNSPYMYMSFSKTPAFTTNEQIQPFDIDSKGMMIGEGIGMVALKRLDDAERDGDRIYAVIKGVGASSDGKFKSIYAPRPEGQAKALERAYDDAGFAPHTVGLIEAHGTGTAAGDVAEFNGLTSVFSKDNEQLQHIALGSVKSQVGHTKSTAGTAGVIKAALALHHKVLPPTINVSQPNPKLNIARSPFYLNTEARPWIQRSDDTPRRAGVSSFGFGGTNFHLVLEEYHPEHARDDAYRQRSVAQSWLFAAADKTALLGELKNALQQATAAKAELSDAHFVAFAKSYALRELPPQSARLGFIAKDYAQLQTLLTQAIAQLESNSAESWQLPSGISFRAQALVKDNNKVAALFAGQGSQYLNMGLEIANNFPELRRHIHASDKVFSTHGKPVLSSVLYPIPAFDDESIKAQETALTNTLYAQSAIGALSMAQYTLLTQAGFAPDMLAGHSFGELSALCAAGVISMDDYIKLAFERGQAMAQSPQDADSSRDAGVMYAVILKQKQDIEAINDCLAQFDDVKIANYNSPTQLVIAGATTATQQAAKAIGELGFKAIALPVSGAFHTPLVAHAQKPFSEAIDKAQFNTPKIALYANGTGQLHPSDANAIKAAFKDHMLQSVHFSEQLEAMYAAGARVFVEFGPKNILQKLTENTLAAQLNELCLISINPNPKADSDSQLRSAAVQLAVAGVTLGEIDPYQAELIAPATPSAMNIKLNATNYISPATRNKMVDSLQSGKITSQVQYVDRLVEKVVEKVVEKPVIVEKILEKVVEVEKPVAQNSNNIQQQTPAQPTSFTTGQANQDALSAFFAAQTQAAQLHQQFLAIPQQYGDTVSALMAEQAKMASLGIAIPESLQRSMELFHQHQAQTLKSHAEFMQLQTSSSQAALALLGQMPAPQVQAPIQAAPVAVAPVAVTAATPVVPAQAPVVQALAAEPKVTAVPVSEPKVQQRQVALPPLAQPQVHTVAAATRALSEKSVVQQIEHAMLAVVADKTGYPVKMLELGMDMEADLGIDSIKRVEILGTVQDQLPNLPELSPEDLAECRTLGEIVALYAGSQASSEAPQQNHAATIQEIQEATAETVEETIDLPPHSEVMLKKLPAAAELARIIATSDVQLTANSYVVIGDDGHNAGVIAEKLHAQGVKVAVVRSPKTVVASASPLDSHIASFTLEAIDDESICEVINQIEALGQIAGFIHLQPQHKSVADKGAGLVLADEAKASVEQAFLFAKHLQPLLTERDYCRFVTVSRIDGGFGYIGMDESAGALISQSELNQAALSGLTKTLNHEWPGVVCRALDIAPNLDAKTVANAVVQEYYLQDAPVEVGIDSELERTTLVAGNAVLRRSGASLSSADKILVTGGAKGVTFECALSLAKRCKAHFILAGRSAHQGIPAWAQGKNRNDLKAAAIAHMQSLGDKPTPKQVDALVWPVQSSLEISHALQAFEAVGASAEYLSLDVNDPAAIASTIAPISALSPITGIIHGAGVLADKHIQDKTLSELERVYGTKVTGLNNLLSALDLSQLTLIALFSSAAGFYGNTGQSDYAMSNDILNKAALQLAQQLPQAKVMSFDWGPWDGGMVNPALKKMFIDRGVYVIPLKAGAELFASQLLSDTGAQLLVGTDMQGNTANAVEAASAKKPEADLTTALDPQPMAQKVPQSIRVMRSLDPKRMSFIEDHCINGHAVLPTVCAIDWMREAAKAHLGKAVSVSDYRLLKGIIFDEALLARNAPIELELMLTPLADATQQSTEALAALISFEGRPQYQAVLVAQTDDMPDAQGLEVGELHSLIEEITQQPAIANRESLYSDGTLFHGPRLQGISEVLAFDDQQLIAKVALPAVALDDCGEFAPNLEDKGTQPFAEDLLLQAMLVWARLKYQAASLPSAIGEFVSYSPLGFGEKAVLVLDVLKHSSRSLEANIALYHQDGRLSCEMKRAKVTISKTLNQAFLANKPQQQTIVQPAVQSTAEVSVK